MTEHTLTRGGTSLAIHGRETHDARMNLKTGSSILLLVALAACTVRSAPSARPDASIPQKKQLIAFARFADEASASGLDSRIGRFPGVHWLLDGCEPKLIKSDDLKGDKPGSYLLAAAACTSRQEAERILDLVQADYPEAFQMEVADSAVLPKCPAVKSAFSRGANYSKVATGQVIQRSKSLHWKVSVATGINPSFRKAPFDSAWLDVESGDTTVCSRGLEAKGKDDTTSSYRYLGMIKGLERDWPVISEMSSWHGGDMCTKDVYVFRGGYVVRAASIEDNACGKRRPDWRVEGSLDEPKIVNKDGVVCRSQWDSGERRYRKGDILL
jgi:hypothetical protein